MEIRRLFIAVFLLSLSSLQCLSAESSSDEFYTLLDIDRSATTKDIRKAFKKMALKMHPDKNTDDPDADSKFIRINRAYEVLKDDELRKKYDQFGEDGLENNNQRGRGYESWSYYRDNFGIYDDDAVIITLSKTDFDASVSGGHTAWFINFYHPNCRHCHELAPDWRWLSYQLQGVVRIGAVNCDDEFSLCRQEGVMSYPSLIAYPGNVKFRLMGNGRESMASFILDRLSTGHGIPVTVGMLHNMKMQRKPSVSGTSSADSPPSPSSKPWLLAVFHSQSQLEDYKLMVMKLAAIFSGTVSVGRVECYTDVTVCRLLNATLQTDTASLLYYPSTPVLGGATPVGIDDTAQDIAKEVLALMPEVQLIDYNEFKDRLSDLDHNRRGGSGWLVQFAGDGDDHEGEFRKLDGLVSPIPYHRVLCSSLPNRECDSLLYLHKTPAFVLFKPGGGYEIHQGRLLAQDIANFAREAEAAPNFRTLTPREFPSILSSSTNWFIDFYAPWCPPCMRLLPVFRQASVSIQWEEGEAAKVQFGIIDCTAHAALCTQFNIRSYPTTLLYNRTTPHQFNGHHVASHFVDFVRDTLQPSVTILTDATFSEMVLMREAGQVWMVDFFASWCGPCLAMAPEYRRFGRMMSGDANVFVASVDCAIHRQLCQSQGVNSYPTIRLYSYPDNTKFSTYSEFSRDAPSFKRWLYAQVPSAVTALTDRTYEDMLRCEEPWLVLFYVNRCHHSRRFMAEFEEVARHLVGVIKLGKVECDVYPWLCKAAHTPSYPTVNFYKGVRQHDASKTHQNQAQAAAPSRDSNRQKPTGEPFTRGGVEYMIASLKLKLQHLHDQDKLDGGKLRQKDEL